MGKRSRSKREQQRIGQRQPPPPPPAQAVESSLSPRGQALICLGLIILVLLVFGRAKSNGFVEFDDPDYVSRNAVVQRGLTAEGIRYAFTSVKPYYWQPLTWLSFELDCSLFGLNPGAMHLESALIHGIAASILFLFFLRATGRAAPAGAVAMLWAVHPLRVESVAWTVERKDVLAGTFILLTLFAYERFVRRRAPWRYAVVLAMFALALMSKASAVSTPFILVALNWWPFGRLETDWRRALTESLAPLVMTIPIVITTFKGQTTAIDYLPLSARLATAVHGICAYVGKLLLPVGLAPIYPYTKFGMMAILWGGLALALTALAWWARDRYPYVAAGWAWYLVAIGPLSGVVQSGMQSMADRFTYIPSIGLFIAAVWFVADLRAVPRTAATAATAFLVVFWSILSFVYVGDWKDTITLFSHAAAVTTDNAPAHMILGNALAAEGQMDAANVHLAEAVRASHGAAMPLASMGAALVQEKRYAEAVDPLEKAVEGDPRIAAAQANLATALINSGRPAEALPHLDEAARLDPSRAIDLLSLRGAARLSLNRTDEAIADFQQVVRQQPSVAAWNNLASAYSSRNDFANAERAYREAIRLDPKAYDPRLNLAAMLSRAGRGEEAMSEVQAATASAPDAVEPRIYLALIEAQLGRYADAVNDATAAQQIDPQRANDYITKALRMPPKDTNLADFIVTMRKR